MNKSFKLTEKGQKQLDAFKERLVKDLLDDIIKNKDYPGIDEIEITANDINESAKKLVYLGNSPKRNRFYLLKICSYVYLAIGIIILVASLCYEDLKRIYERSPEQISFMLLGCFISLFGTLILIYVKKMEVYNKTPQVSHAA